MSDRLSPHFTLHELTRSAKAAALGIANTPTATEMAALSWLAQLVLEPARAEAGGPLEVTSGFRCLALNRAVGSKDGSQHVRGEAADVKASIPSRDLAARLYAVRHLLPIRQCIWYDPGRGGHLHLSIDLAALGNGTAPKREWLHAPDGGTSYVPWRP